MLNGAGSAVLNGLHVKDLEAGGLVEEIDGEPDNEKEEITAAIREQLDNAAAAGIATELAALIDTENKHLIKSKFDSLERATRFRVFMKLAGIIGIEATSALLPQYFLGNKLAIQEKEFEMFMELAKLTSLTHARLTMEKCFEREKKRIRRALLEAQMTGTIIELLRFLATDDDAREDIALELMQNGHGHLVAKNRAAFGKLPPAIDKMAKRYVKIAEDLEKLLTSKKS